MKNFSAILILIFFAGCVSLPDKIDPEFLKNKTPEEEQKLDTIEKEKITISDEKDKADQALSVTELRIPVIKGEISTTESEIKNLNQKQDLYLKTNDQTKLEEVKKDLLKNQNILRLKKEELKYFQAKKEQQMAQADLKAAELSVKVGEQRYEEAKIGRKNEDLKRGPAQLKDGKPQDKDRINVGKYEEYYKSEKEKIPNKQKDLDKTTEELRKADASLKAAGYTGDL